MRARTFSAVGAGVAALVLATLLAPVASAHTSTTAGTGRLSAPAQRSARVNADICYRNMRPRHATGADIPSVNYDDQNSTLDSQAADDFTLTEPCFAKRVDVSGTFDQASVVDWETVYIYPDAGGKPGRPAIWVQSALNGKQGDQPGDFNIRFGPLLLQPGTYWISVQAQLKSGQWGWDNSDRAQGSAAVFQNPDNGFGVGCPTWTAIQTCFPATPGPDLMFAISQ